MNRTGVTRIFLSGLEAKVTAVKTIVMIYRVEPSKALDAIKLSLMYRDSVFRVDDSAEEILEKMSGAPLPKERSVTPANDCDIPSFLVRRSSEGER